MFEINELDTDYIVIPKIRQRFCFQKLGTSMTRTAKNSKRPRIIHKLHTFKEKFDMKANVPYGPACLKASPALFIQLDIAVRAVSGSIPSIHKIKVPSTDNAIKVTKKHKTVVETDSSTRMSLILNCLINPGRYKVSNFSLTILYNKMILMVLIPPDVDPDMPPKYIAIKSKT